MIRARAECIGSRAELRRERGHGRPSRGNRIFDRYSGPGEGQGAVSEELGRLEGVGEAGRERLVRNESWLKFKNLGTPAVSREAEEVGRRC